MAISSIVIALKLWPCVDLRDVARRSPALSQPAATAAAAESPQEQLAGHRSAHRNPPSGCLRWRNRFPARSRKRICAIAVSRRCTNTAALRFHPRCYYRPDIDEATEIWPALIAAVADLAGNITGAHRTWLDPTGEDKAPVDTPRRALGHLLGNGVRFAVATDVMAAGEGIETMLSLRSALPGLPMVAALSANHLAALLFRVTLRRLYVVRDNDPAGDFAVATLTGRAQAAGIEALTLSPTLGDFNEDLRRLGIDHLRAALRAQLAPDDVPRFLSSTDEAESGR